MYIPISNSFLHSVFYLCWAISCLFSCMYILSLQRCSLNFVQSTTEALFLIFIESRLMLILFSSQTKCGKLLFFPFLQEYWILNVIISVKEHLGHGCILNYPGSALKHDLPGFLSLNSQQSAKRNHYLWYVKCTPSTVLNYAIYSVLMGLAEIFHYYSVSCLWLCLEVDVTIVIMGLFIISESSALSTWARHIRASSFCDI